MDHDECPICLDILNTSTIITLKCKHKFHKKCIDELIKSNSYIVYCPLCRKDIYHHPIELPSIILETPTNISQDHLISITNIEIDNNVNNNMEILYNNMCITFLVCVMLFIFYNIYEYYNKN